MERSEGITWYMNNEQAACRPLEYKQRSMLYGAMVG